MPIAQIQMMNATLIAVLFGDPANPPALAECANGQTIEGEYHEEATNA